MALSFADPSIAKLRTRFHAVTGILDQGVIGAGNLAVGLLVLHGTSKEGYGLYTLGYMAVVTVSSLVNALFAGPMIAGFFNQPERARHAFAAGAFRAALLAAMAIGSGAAIGGLALGTGEWRWLLPAAGCAAIGMTAQDFLRYYLFVLRRGPLALTLDSVALLLWAISTSALHWFATLPMELAALTGYALATLVTAGAAVIDTRLHPAADPAATPATYWRRGHWNLSGAAVTAVQNQGHVYLAGLILSATAVADLNASRLLMAPMSLLVIGANRTLVPALARTLANTGSAAANRLARRALALLLVVILLYSAALLIARTGLLAAVLGPRYGDVGLLLTLWMGVTLLQAVDMNLSASMQAAQRFRNLALINLWTSIPVLVLAVPMIRHFGVVGNLLVLGGGYAALDLLLAWQLYGRRSRHTGAAT